MELGPHRMLMGALICAEGISQAGMPAFQFGVAREREKLVKRASHRFGSRREKDYGRGFWL